MKPQRILVLFSVFLMVVWLAGCSFPFSAPATPVFPTPNLTMTAIFNQPVAVSVPPTVTSAPNNASNPPAVNPTQSTAHSPATPDATSTPIVRTPTPGSVTTTPTSDQPGTTAAFLSSAPKIDGVWDEWNTTQYPIRAVVFGASTWKNTADLSGAYRIGWDDTYLYLAVKVNDNTYSQNATGTNIYKGDSIELLLSTAPAGDTNKDDLSNDDYQLGISPGNPEVGKNTEAYLWFPAAKAGSQTAVQRAAVSMKGGYRLEAAIPWSIFGITPASGQTYAFAISISDNDQPGKVIQEKMISSAPNRDLSDPSTWGILTLSK
jgi:hypothetical protein